MSSPETTPEFKIVDLFAGPGGLDMAAHVLGVPVTGVEWDDNACQTRTAAGLATVKGDVRLLDPGHFDANVLAGGPPCQTFTVAGKGAGRQALDQVLDFARRMAKGEDVRGELDALEDERTGLVLEPLRWALTALADGAPGYDTIVLEQVPAVLPVWQEYKRILEERGYSAECTVLHTEEFGVPQTRRRAILIARKRPADSVLSDVVEFPKPTHRRFRKGAAQDTHDAGLQPWVTMGKALKDVRTPYEVVSNYGTGGDPAARGRRGHDEPAFTVTGKVSRNWLERPDIPLDPKNKERFGLPQSGVLQTFPANYPWRGNDQAQQIGNAIPPRLGVHVLAAALRRGSGDVEVALKTLDTWEPSNGTSTMYSVDEWKQKVASDKQAPVTVGA
ncbi:DNA cytosine methyltransferase [Streptomyces sp. NRRL S-495]|uniref:DNA cytosine methyltransferase n=1 Tax=Streptomyces sp. NRRL S-495 TaxID=1609133 RepID=UPI0007C6E89E|nr:DNA cytosine methyltransferase [Streptomyces sp. NRRL S-495]